MMHGGAQVEVTGPLRVSGLSPKETNTIRGALRLRNPTYEQAIRTNPRARFALSEWIEYSAMDGDILVAPGGTLERLVRFFERSGKPFRVDDRRADRPVDIATNIQLRSYQAGVPQQIGGTERGVVVLSTGWGKTYAAIKLLSVIGQRSLIVVPTNDIFNQFVTTIEATCGFTPGRIQGKHNSRAAITIATIQSLARRVSTGDCAPDEFGAIVVDECHLFVTKKRMATLDYFCPRYRYGFTATGRRSDGQGEAIYWFFGPKIIEREIPRDQPSVTVLNSPHKIWVQDYHAMIEEQVTCGPRNEMIATVVRNLIDAGRRVLVLTKRIAHFEDLHDRVACPNSLQLRSDTKETERKATMDMLKQSDAEYSALFSTFSLLSTGVDIPTLDTLILAGDLKSDVLVEQSAGRILRLLDGKPDTRIVDICDVNNGILRKQAKLRQQFYRSRGWAVDVVDNPLDVSG